MTQYWVDVYDKDNGRCTVYRGDDQNVAEAACYAYLQFTAVQKCELYCKLFTEKLLVTYTVQRHEQGKPK